MWSEEIGRGGETAATRIQSAAELIDSYVERLLAPAAGRNAVRLDNLRLDLAAIASRELGESLTPGWLTRTLVLDALRERIADGPELRIDVSAGQPIAGGRFPQSRTDADRARPHRGAFGRASQG
jgi:hypothetical protein